MLLAMLSACSYKLGSGPVDVPGGASLPQADKVAMAAASRAASRRWRRGKAGEMARSGDMTVGPF